MRRGRRASTWRWDCAACDAHLEGGEAVVTLADPVNFFVLVLCVPCHCRAVNARARSRRR